MIDPDELPLALHSAVSQRLRDAVNATPGPWRWRVQGSVPSRVLLGNGDSKYPGPLVVASDNSKWPSVEDASFMETNDPERIIRSCTRDLAVLDRHYRIVRLLPACFCGASWPCPELTAMYVEYFPSAEDDDDKS